jgi:hypothetical protein
MGSGTAGKDGATTDPAIQRQDSAGSLASAASSAVDMASVEREASVGSASSCKGTAAGAAAILPLVTLEELDLKPFFALAPSSGAAAAGSDAAAAAVAGDIGAYVMRWKSIEDVSHPHRSSHNGQTDRPGRQR